MASTGGLVAPLLYVGDGEHAALEGGSVGGLLDMCELFLVGAVAGLIFVVWEAAWRGKRVWWYR